MKQAEEKKKTAYYHLPGLFEFYDFYREFLPLFREKREWFYDWCEIGSVYGAPENALWGGGRVGSGDTDARKVEQLFREYGISSRLTFSNSLLREEHLSDRKCNELCRIFAGKGGPENGVIVHSELLKAYLERQYPELYLVSSTTKVLTDFNGLLRELDRKEFSFVVPDFRLNGQTEKWKSLTAEEKAKVEFLCNECCDPGCTERKHCYENVSRLNLGEEPVGYRCSGRGGEKGYCFSEAQKSPCFIGTRDVLETYLPMGFSQFKIEGRGLGSALLLEFILYYMTKPEYWLPLREELYLENGLDLF